LNILIISKYLSSSEVGFESRLFALSRIFSKKGNQVTIITSDSNHFAHYPNFNAIFNFLPDFDFKVICIKTIKYYKTISIRRILSWLDFEFKLAFMPLSLISRPDVIIISSLSLLTILNGIRLKKKYNCKLVFEIRDIWPLTIIEEAGYSKWNLFVVGLSIIEKYGYKKSDLIVGTMPNLKQHVDNVSRNNGFKCVCVPFGFDLLNYSKIIIDTKSFVEKYPFLTNKFVVGYAGSIGLSNGLSSFIECAKLLSADDRFLFVLMGSGDTKERLMRLSKNHTNIIFLPKVKREEVASFLSLCSILYFSSINSKVWEYGWSPNKLIDYMMSGKPILAAYSGHRSMINEANSGFFVEADNVLAIKEKLLDIIEMPQTELENIGKAGYNWIIENRTWNQIAELYLKYLNQIVVV